MARAVSTQPQSVVTVLAWAIGLLIFFPILWTILTSFKTEGDAISICRRNSCSSTGHWKTMASCRSAPTISRFVMNSVIMLALGSTFFALVIAIPVRLGHGLRARQAHQGSSDVDAVHQDDAAGRRADPDLPDLPRPGLLDTRGGIITVLMLLNLPIIIWMLYTYFKEIPGEILEASRMDGASLGKELLYVLTPMAIPGIASTLLLNIILAWNEAFWTLSLTTKDAAPLTQFIASPTQAPKACSGPSSRRPRPWPSRPSWSSAGFRRNNLSAVSHSEQ